MATMMLKQRVMDPKMRDDLSEALAYEETADDGFTRHRVVPVYLYHWYPPGLKELTVGPHSKALVGITRYYPTCRPLPVAVDFEPAPPEKWFEDQKRRYCIEHGIVYIPIELNARLSEEEFKDRFRVCRKLTEEGREVFMENRALASATLTVEDWMQDPTLIAAVDARCLADLVAEEEALRKSYRGMSKMHVLRRLKRELLGRLRDGLKQGTIHDPKAWLDSLPQPATK